MPARSAPDLLVAIYSVAAAAAFLVFAACTPRPLPEADSEAAHVYVQKCSQCHRAYDPRSMTATMWQTQVAAMDEKMRQPGFSPLTDDQRRVILDYLIRNAGSQ